MHLVVLYSQSIARIIVLIGLLILLLTTLYLMPSPLMMTFFKFILLKINLCLMKYSSWMNPEGRILLI
jgi:hypothetical protein